MTATGLLGRTHGTLPWDEALVAAASSGKEAAAANVDCFSDQGIWWKCIIETRDRDNNHTKNLAAMHRHAMMECIGARKSSRKAVS